MKDIVTHLKVKYMLRVEVYINSFFCVDKRKIKMGSLIGLRLINLYRDKTIMINKLKQLKQQIMPFVIPTKGNGELSSLQKIISISIDIFVICFVLSIVIAITDNDDLDIVENYCIGIACSIIVVLFTTLIQYLREHTRLIREFNEIVFPMLLILYQMTEENHSEGYEYELTQVKTYVDKYFDIITELYWFNCRKLEIYYIFSKEMTNLFLLLHGDSSEKEIVAKLNGDGSVVKCIKYMFDLFKDDKVNRYKMFLDLDELQEK